MKPADYTHKNLKVYVDDLRLNRTSNGRVSVYSYTRNTQYDRLWDDVTLNTRGVILDDNTGELLALPFGKFFNIGEPILSEWTGEYDKSGLKINRVIAAADPLDGPFIATTKYDGSLGISYYLDDQVYWSTRGSPKSSQAALANMIWKIKYNHVQVPREWTLIAEIIHPDARIVVNYEDMKDLILLAIRNRLTGKELSFHAVKDWADSVGMSCTQIFSCKTLAELVEKAATLSANHEGWVLRWDNNFSTTRLKIKGLAYLHAHRIIAAMSERQLILAWKEMTLTALIAPLSDDHQAWISEKITPLNDFFSSLTIKAYQEADTVRCYLNNNGNMKAVVEHLDTKALTFGATMMILRNQDPTRALRKATAQFFLRKQKEIEYE